MRVGLHGNIYVDTFFCQNMHLQLFEVLIPRILSYKLCCPYVYPLIDALIPNSCTAWTLSGTGTYHWATKGLCTCMLLVPLSFSLSGNGHTSLANFHTCLVWTLAGIFSIFYLIALLLSSFYISSIRHVCCLSPSYSTEKSNTIFIIIIVIGIHCWSSYKQVYCVPFSINCNTR